MRNTGNILAAALAIAVAAAPGTVPAAVIGADGRGPLNKKAAELGLSSAEVESLRAATGFIVCPGTTHNNGIVASAALVVSNRVLLTVGHALVDEHGRERGPLAACVFRTQGSNAVEVPIDPASLVLGLEGAAEVHSPTDFAVVALSRAVRAEPLPVRIRPVEEGAEAIGIAAWQQLEGVDLDANMPVAQLCTVRSIEAASGSRPTNLVTDCDLGQVGSGGQLLTRVEGQLAVTAIFSSSASSRADGKAFDIRLGRYTQAIAIDSTLLTAIEQMLDALGR